MKRAVLAEISTAAASLAVALGFPLAVALYFRAEGAVVPVLAAAAVLNGLFFLRRRLGGNRQASAPRRAAVWPRPVITTLLALVFAFSAFVLVVYIIVIPFSYYLAWLDVAASLKPGGIIAFLFFAVTAWFAGLFGGAAHASGPARPAAGAAVVALFEAAVVFRTVFSVVIFSAALVLAVALLARGRKKTSLRRLVPPLAFLGAAIGAAALLAVGSRPNSGQLTRTSLLSDIKRLIVEMFPDLTALSTVSGYGFSFEKVEMGRRPILSTVPLLSVRGAARRAVYLRTQVYDDYFNNSWAVGRFFADRMIADRDEALAVPQGEKPGLTVTVLFDYFPMLPHTLSASGVAVTSDPPVGIADGNFDSGFDLDRPLLKGAEVRIFYPAPTAAVTPAEGLAAGAEREWGEAPEIRPFPAGPVRDGLLARYLILPSSLTPRIYDLARALKGQETAPWKILMNIGEYLKNNYAYSLDTTVPPAGEEFLDDFLFVTHRGYCVHFATAFAVLARCAGVPARYATGFLAFPPAGGGEATVSGLHAHAWPEAWVENVGWVSLEATPAFDPGSALLPDYYRRFNRGGDELTARHLEALMGGRIPAPAGPERDPAAFWRRLLQLPPFAGAIVLAVLFAGAAVAFARRRAGRRRTYRGRPARLNRRLCRLVKAMERRSVAAPETAGWVAWGEAVARRLPAEARHVRAFVRTANRLFFGRAPVTQRHLRYARALSARLTRRMR